MQTLIIVVDRANENHLLGYIKFGKRSLYFYDKKGAVTNKPDQICCLDFYVEEVTDQILQILYNYLVKY